MEKHLSKKLLEYMRPNSEINLAGIPSTDAEIINAETILNVTFHDDYKNFIKEFGGAYAGIPIHAFQNNEMMSEETVIDLTKTFRVDYEDDYRSELLNSSYVISMDGSGNPILIDTEGKVVIVYHDCDEYKVMAESLSKLLEDMVNGDFENDY